MNGINNFEVDAIPHAQLQQMLKKYNLWFAKTGSR